MSVLEITAGLQKLIKSLPGCPPVCDMNMDFKEIGVTHFLSDVVFVSVTPMGFGEEAKNLHRGFQQVTVCIPAGEGCGEALDLVDAILDLYERGKRITEGSSTILIENASATAPVKGQVYFQVPVTISWSSEQPK